MTTKKIKSTKKKRNKVAKKKQLSQNARIFMASTFLLGFVFACLFLLVNLQANFQQEVESSEKLVFEESVTASHQQKAYHYSDVLTLVENQLINGPHSTGWRKLPDKNNIQVRRIFGDFPTELFLFELISHIEQSDSSAQLKVSRDKGIIHLYWQDDLKLELKYQLPPAVAPRQAKIAIIMDDLGDSLSFLQKLLRLEINITPSILPGTSRALAATALLQQAEREYLIHIPMQPISYPHTNPGENALFLGQSEAETRQLVRSYIAGVPGAVGGNNHMGSLYTTDPEAMRIVLSELKTHNLFFIDSRTIGNSVAFLEARKMGLKTATRSIFLDNGDDVAAIRKQIRKMVRLAGTDREIIAICHPYAATLEAFRLEQEWLQQQPVDFVPASALVHVY